MSIELYEKLSQLLESQQLDEAIKIAEADLMQMDHSPFHKVISKNLLHLQNNLSKYIDTFYIDSTTFLNKGKTKFLSSIFKPKNVNKELYKCFYCEMNGFSINYDRWYIDLFAFEADGNFENFDWLADFQYSSENSFTITGFEELQETFKDYMETEKWKDENLSLCCSICEFLIILRLQELFRQTILEAKKLNQPWAKTPIYISAHDYQIIYRTQSKFG